MEMRLEKDSIGALYVPADAYYGVQSLRGAQNFRILDQKLNPYFIKNIARIKKAAAKVNFELGDLSREKRDAIIAASDDIIGGKLLDGFTYSYTHMIISL